MAAILDLQVRSCAIAPRLHYGSRHDVVAGENVTYKYASVVRCEVIDNIDNFRFVGISHHPFDTRKAVNLLRRPLRVASSHQDFCGGILAVDAADGLTDIVIGRRRYRAGIEDHQIGLGALAGRLHTVFGKFCLQGRAIGLRRPTAKILNEKLLHLSLLCPFGPEHPYQSNFFFIETVAFWRTF